MSVEYIIGAPKPSDPPQAPKDGAFRQTESGLIVPAELSRDREVWTWDEWKVLERATKLLESRGLRLFLRCDHSRECMAHPIERIRNADGGLTMRCHHLDRVFRKDI